MRSSQLLFRKPVTMSARPPAPDPEHQGTDSDGEHNPWRDSSMDLVQGLDVIEATFDTIPGEFQGAFVK